MRLDIIGSIILTLVLMMIAHIFRLDMFGCILLMIFSFCVMRYFGDIKSYISQIRFWRFSKRIKGKQIKSSYDVMELEE